MEIESSIQHLENFLILTEGTPRSIFNNLNELKKYCDKSRKGIQTKLDTFFKKEA